MKPTFSPRSRARSSSVRRVRSVPSSVTLPPLGVSSPARSPSSVVFPLPDGPTMDTKEPCGMSKDTCLSTARREAPLWYSFVRSLAESMQSMRAKWRIALVLLGACGGADSKAKARPAPMESTTVAAGGATSAVPGTTGVPRVLFLGTSLTAGFGLDDPATDAYPAVIQRVADSVGVKAFVVNAGLSGETSAGALRRVDWLLREKPDVVVIETGANDGLRGLNPDSTAGNIRQIIGRIRAVNPAAGIVLVQMEAPTNLGPAYTRAFHALFGKVAVDEKVTLSPFLLDHVGGIARLNQGDGIHPTAEGARIAAHNLWPSLRAVLLKR